MKIHSPISIENLPELINPSAGSAGLFAYEGSSTLSIKEAVSKMKAAHPAGLKNLWIIVGSEGGFSHREVEQFQKLGLDPVTLGPQVLRVETACMALVSVVKYDFDLMC